MTKNIHDELRESLEIEIDKIYTDEEKIEEPEPVKEVEPQEEEEKEPENIEDEDEEVEAEDEAEEEKEITETEEEKNFDLERKLSGQPKEFKELVKSVADPDLQTKILEAGKISRAREDRLSLELGNLKKEYSNATDVLKNLQKNPVETLKDLAKVLKVDINALADKAVVDEDDDYRTPNERKKDQEFEDIKNEVASFKKEKIERQNQEVANQITNFTNAKNEDGTLKHPHFEQVRFAMSQLVDLDPNITIEQAYLKAVLLDDNLRVIRDAELLAKAAKKRREEIEKAKKEKKFANRSSNVKTAPANARAGLVSIVDRFYEGTL